MTPESLTVLQAIVPGYLEETWAAFVDALPQLAGALVILGVG